MIIGSFLLAQAAAAIPSHMPAPESGGCAAVAGAVDGAGATLSGAMSPVVDEVPGSLSAEQWGHLVSATVIWFVIPFAIGIWRVLNAEVK